ncbi:MULTISPECIES: hypothetical protein [unclassified Stenotrophomonas]|uniref:hypothetical protein n=1 Tax=unclassified Stenotrophomonas TaxID=196198 RepID=UPI003F971708
MLDQLAELEREFGAYQAAALALSLRIGEMEKPSRDVLAAQRDLRKEGERLKKALNEQWEAVGNGRRFPPAAVAGRDAVDPVRSGDRLGECASWACGGSSAMARCAPGALGCSTEARSWP